VCLRRKNRDTFRLFQSPVHPKHQQLVQVAALLGVSISTVRRYEGSRLHPKVGDDDVHWFDPKEVAAVAVELTNEPRTARRRNANATIAPAHSRDEIAALVFERLEQRQSLAEIVIGVRIEPDTACVVRAMVPRSHRGTVTSDS
jgi:hypothetical protein